MKEINNVGKSIKNADGSYTDVMNYLVENPKAFAKYLLFSKTYEKAIENIVDKTKLPAAKGQALNELRESFNDPELQTAISENSNLGNLCKGLLKIADNMYDKYSAPESGKDINEVKNDIQHDYSIDSKDLSDLEAEVGKNVEKESENLASEAETQYYFIEDLYDEITANLERFSSKNTGYTDIIKEQTNILENYDKHPTDKITDAVRSGDICIDNASFDEKQLNSLKKSFEKTYKDISLNHLDLDKKNTLTNVYSVVVSENIEKVTKSFKESKDGYVRQKGQLKRFKGLKPDPILKTAVEKGESQAKDEIKTRNEAIQAVKEGLNDFIIDYLKAPKTATPGVKSKSDVMTEFRDKIKSIDDMTANPQLAPIVKKINEYLDALAKYAKNKTFVTDEKINEAKKEASKRAGFVDEKGEAIDFVDSIGQQLS